MDNARFTGEPKQSGGYIAPPHPAEMQNTPSAISSGSIEDFTAGDDDDDYPF